MAFSTLSMTMVANSGFVRRSPMFCSSSIPGPPSFPGIQSPMLDTRGRPPESIEFSLFCEITSFGGLSRDLSRLLYRYPCFFRILMIISAVDTIVKIVPPISFISPNGPHDSFSISENNGSHSKKIVLNIIHVLCRNSTIGGLSCCYMNLFSI